jgi:DME family drug/metabolite transporter
MERITMKNQLPMLWALMAAVLWGTTGTVQSLAPEDTNPISFGAMRLAIGGATLLLIVGLQGQLRVKGWPLKQVLFASVSMACYQPFFFSAVKMTGIAVGTVVAIGSAPILAGLMEWALLRQKPAKNWWIATFTAIFGCVLLFTNKGSAVIEPLGLLWALGAGASFAAYTLVSKKLLETQSSNAVTAVVFTLSACMLAPLLFLFDLSWLLQANGAAASLYLGVFATGLAYLLFAKALVKLPASTVVTLSLAEPLTAALFGAFLIGEALTVTSWLGIGLLFLSIMVLSLAPGKRKGRIPPKLEAVGK